MRVFTELFIFLYFYVFFSPLPIPYILPASGSSNIYLLTTMGSIIIYLSSYKEQGLEHTCSKTLVHVHRREGTVGPLNMATRRPPVPLPSIVLLSTFVILP